MEDAHRNLLFWKAITLAAYLKLDFFPCETSKEDNFKKVDQILFDFQDTHELEFKKKVCALIQFSNGTF